MGGSDGPQPISSAVGGRYLSAIRGHCPSSMGRAAFWILDLGFLVRGALEVPAGRILTIHESFALTAIKLGDGGETKVVEPEWLQDGIRARQLTGDSSVVDSAYEAAERQHVSLGGQRWHRLDTRVSKHPNTGARFDPAVVPGLRSVLTTRYLCHVYFSIPPPRREVIVRAVRHAPEVQVQSLDDVDAPMPRYTAAQPVDVAGRLFASPRDR